MPQSWRLKMFNSLFKVILAPIDLTVSAIADVVTLGGALNDKNSTYTGAAAGRLVDNAKNLVDPKK